MLARCARQSVCMDCMHACISPSTLGIAVVCKFYIIIMNEISDFDKLYKASYRFGAKITFRRNVEAMKPRI